MKPMVNYKANSIALAAVAALSLAALPAANAQDASAMAPPVTPAPATPATTPAPATTAPFDANAPASQSVYSWHDVPVGQKVTITRAVFDQGGYQLYDDKGETIVVPFVNQNLYVMRFGRTDGETYFVNDGTTPTLYLPRGGFLTNSAAQGSRWYPFDKDTEYTRPVYEGPAPDWDAYVNMAWYPDMAYYGGYWGYNPWAFGLAFSPSPGLYFNIGGLPYYGWGAYHNYYYGHSYNRFYVHDSVAYNHYNVGPRGSGSFGSYHGNVAYHASGGILGRSSYGRPGFGTSRSSELAPRGFGGTTRAFGTTTATHAFGTTTATHSFGNPSRGAGTSTTSFGSNRSFGSSSSFRSSSFSGGHSFSGSSFGSHASSGSSFGGGGRSFGGGGGGGSASHGGGGGGGHR